jgi:group I intron endonuclease
MYVLYKITCSANGKAYVGYSSKSAEDRFRAHLLNARWKRKTALCDAIRCYGDAAFSVEVILTCETHAEACAHEIRLIAELGSILPLGYNMTKGGDGVPLTQEQREAANAKKRGVCSPKQLAANRRRKGQKASEETRAKLSAARKGRKQSPEQVAKRLETFRKNREKKIAAGLIAAPKARVPRGPNRSGKASRTKKSRVWSLEDRARERQRALAQWTPEAKQAAKDRAAKQWTPEARKKVSERMLARYAKNKAERLAA